MPKITINLHAEPESGATLELHHFSGGKEPSANDEPKEIYQLNYGVSSVTLDLEKGDVLEVVSDEAVETVTEGENVDALTVDTESKTSDTE